MDEKTSANDSTGPALPKLLSVLDRLTEEELVQLNRIVIERVRLMQQIRAHNNMMKFRLGQRVSFTDHNGQTIRGVLTKLNQKSVTVIADGGHSWRVSPSLLKPE